MKFIYPVSHLSPPDFEKCSFSVLSKSGVTDTQRSATAILPIKKAYASFPVCRISSGKSICKKETCKTFHSKDISIFQSCLCFAGLLMIPLCRSYPCKVDLLVIFHIRSRQIQSINKLLDTVVASRGLQRLRVSCQHDVRLFLNVLSSNVILFCCILSYSFPYRKHIVLIVHCKSASALQAGQLSMFHTDTLSYLSSAVRT